MDIEELAGEIIPQSDRQKIVHSLNRITAPGRSMDEAVQEVIRDIAGFVTCDHLFLSRYEASIEMFKAIAWDSSINPGSVPLAQKFMGSSYLENLPVVVNDLSQFNYRLRPGVARLGLMSMVGIPIISFQGTIGVLEAFSSVANQFSEEDIDCLILFARQIGSLMEKVDLMKENNQRMAENSFLIEALKVEQVSIGSLLYKVGELFGALFNVDGIAVFGMDPDVKGNPLQEVMAKGFAMADLGRLKGIFNKEYLERLAALPQGEDLGIIKNTMHNAGSKGAKMLYTVPIIYKKALHGLIIFYWKGTDKEIELANLEKFVRRIIGDILVILSRKHLYSNIQRISFSDILTGLANRRLFDYVFDRELKKAKRYNKPVSLLLVDIDFFKRVNDTFGHIVGDVVLEHVAASLKASCRSVDLVARYGGEEFAVILPETDLPDAVVIAERAREKIASHRIQIGDQSVNVTISIGGATYDGSSRYDGGDSLILATDQALYKAKQTGRNKVVYAGRI